MLWGFGGAFARKIEKDVGVKVALSDFTTGTLNDVLEVLKTGKSANIELKKLPAALKKADVVVMSLSSPIGSLDPVAGQSLQVCHDSGVPTATCTPATFEKYTAGLKGIWAKVFELRSGKTTVLRALDWYNPFVGPWKEYQIFDVCTTCWEYLSASARQAAEEYHIPFLSRYDAFNGWKHDEDPRQKGYIKPDGMHPTDLANSLSAELVAKLGYDPVPPPSK